MTSLAGIKFYRMWFRWKNNNNHRASQSRN